MKLSLHMIARNNADVIGQTLACVTSFTDEIIVVDTGSTDDTKAIAESYGAQVFDFEWVDDFSAARNFALSKCTGDWTFWLDTGDTLPDFTIQWFKKFKESDISNSDVELIWGILNRTHDQHGNVTKQIWGSRVARRIPSLRWIEPIHEFLVTDKGVSVKAEGLIVVDHDGGSENGALRNIEVMKKALAMGHYPRLFFLYARELIVLERYEEALPILEEFVAKGYGEEYPIADIYRYLGKCQIKVGKIEEGITSLLRSIHDHPTLAEPWWDLGDLYYTKEDWTNAIPFYTAITGMKCPPDVSFPTNVVLYSYAPYERLGFCYLGLENDKRAVEMFQEAIRLAPPHIKAYLKDLVRYIKGKMKEGK